MNYLKTQKTVVRVSPEVPLHNIIPAICEKCEVSQEHLVLLRDGITGEELELTKSLEELGIKELYAWDRKKGEPRLKAVTAGLYGVTTILWAIKSTRAGILWGPAETAECELSRESSTGLFSELCPEQQPSQQCAQPSLVALGPGARLGWTLARCRLA